MVLFIGWTNTGAGPPMYLMYGDEADHTQGDKDFVVCGAIFIDAERAKALHDAVAQARRDAAFAPTDSLKSATITKPAGCSKDTHTELKNRVLALAQEHGVTFRLRLLERHRSRR